MNCATGIVVALLLVAGCSSTPQAPAPPPDPALPLPSVMQDLTPAQRFEQQLLVRAREQQAQNRLAEAAQSWEILLALRPADTGYTQQLAATRKQIDAALQRALQRGAQLHKSGDAEGAANQFLEALALQPDQPDAAAALRAIERERVRRAIAARMARVNANPPPPAAPTPPPPVAERGELEHAAILAALGETDAAVALLERRLAANRADAAACRQLVEIYQRRAPLNGSSACRSGSAPSGAPAGPCRCPARASAPNPTP